MKYNIIVYDFDKTIYHGDSSLDFIKYLIFSSSKSWIFLPVQVFYGVLFIVGLISSKKIKEILFLPINNLNIKDLNDKVSKFWKKKNNRIYEFMKKQIEKDKNECDYLICISASPSFLINNIIYKLKFNKLIATEFIKDKNNDRYISKIQGKNCKGKEKLNRLLLWAEENNLHISIKKAYTDSKNDLPLLNESEKKYFIKKQQIISIYAQ